MIFTEAVVFVRDHVSTLIVSELIVSSATVHPLNCEQRCVVMNASDKTKQWNRHALTVSLYKTHMVVLSYWN